MKQFYKNYLQNNLFFWVFGGLAALLIVASWIAPPTGVISASVLAGVGELFAFTSLGAVIKAIDSGKTAKVSKGDIDITIGDKDE